MGQCIPDGDSDCVAGVEYLLSFHVALLHAEVFVGDPRDGPGSAESTGRRRPIAMAGKSIIWFKKEEDKDRDRDRESKEASTVACGHAWTMVLGSW